MASIRRMDFDGVIVGGGGAGMRASLKLPQSGLKTAVITKANLEAYFAASPLAGYKILRQMITVLAQRLRQTNISYSSLMHVACYARCRSSACKIASISSPRGPVCA